MARPGTHPDEEPARHRPAERPRQPTPYRWVRRAVGAVVAALIPLGITQAAADTPTAAAETEDNLSPPNIVVIMVDDMRADDLQYMPRTQQRIGGHGVRFANAFAPHPLCCPARASVLTGLYTHNHDVYTVHPPYAFPALKDDSTVATWLQDAGYATVYLGKYLNGYGYLPPAGATSGDSVSYVPPGWTDWRASIDGGLPKSHPDHGGTYRYFDTTLSANGEGFDNYAGRYQTQVYGQLSTRIIASRAESEQPFFLYASYTAPHNGGPIEPDDPGRVRRSDGVRQMFGTPARPPAVMGMFDAHISAAPGADWDPAHATDKPEYLRDIPATTAAEQAAMLTLTRQRAEALRVVDRQVQRTVQALRDSGELDDTLLMFTSDNGYFLGEQGVRQGKLLPHEPSLRVPLLARGPGIPSGEVRYDPFMSMDFAPTLASAAGVAPGHPVDGISMLDVATSGDQGWTRAVLTATGPRSSVRETDESGEPLDVTDPGARDVRWAIGIRTDRYLYVDLATGEEELYDLTVDPEQYHNVAASPRYDEVVALLRAELKALRACEATACTRPLPPRLAVNAGAPAGSS